MTTLASPEAKALFDEESDGIDFDPLGNSCHDCGAEPGEPCAPDCDARCTDCGETVGRCTCTHAGEERADRTCPGCGDDPCRSACTSGGR